MASINSRNTEQQHSNMPNNNTNNNNNNNLNNVYGAVIMTKSLQEFTPGSSDECMSAPGGCRPSDQANRLGLRVRL